MSLRLVKSEQSSPKSSERSLELTELDAAVGSITEHSKMGSYIYAYHYARLGHVLKATELLNRLDEDFFDKEIFKELYRSMLGERLAVLFPEHPAYARQYEVYLLVAGSFEYFMNLDFKAKDAFLRFAGEFAFYTNFE